MRYVGLTGVYLVAAAALAVAGCGQPRATIRYATGGLAEPVGYDSATCLLGRDRKDGTIRLPGAAPPAGEADSDFEYLFFELPERAQYGWLRADRVPAYRWVHKKGQDYVWLGFAGQVQLRMRNAKQRLSFDFRVTMEPVAGTPGAAYVLAGKPAVVEDTVKTQSLINRYGERLSAIVNPKPAEQPTK